MTALASSLRADQVTDTARLTDGLSAAFLGAAGIALIGAITAVVTLRRHRAPGRGGGGMTRNIAPLTPETAQDKSRELLDGIIGRHGSAGDLVATMAHSPALLQGYLDLSRAMKRVKLPRQLSEKVSLAAQGWIGCQTCMAAHVA
ncbi:MAG: hypothetical protein ACJ73U_35330, partial [Actinophytocola sp.]